MGNELLLTTPNQPKVVMICSRRMAALTIRIFQQALTHLPVEVDLRCGNVRNILKKKNMLYTITAQQNILRDNFM